jgi:uncharacterized protein involved in exopolysaccharide biosynthesis
MNIFQFIRIFWARRALLIAATLSTLAGALVVMLIVPTKWTATTRVIMETLKPDPVTGQVLGKAATIYILAQQAMITDYTVAGRVADQLGWMSDPNLIARYRARPSNDTRDFRHWIAYNVIQKTSADVVQGTNILEINYNATKPDDARAVAEALRRAYIDTSLSLRRDSSNRDADWYAEQAQKAKQQLDQAQAAVAGYEQASGISMADPKTDIDTQRLRTLAGQGALPPITPPPPDASPVEVQLAQLDGELAEQTKILGPNHPDVQTLRAKRDSLAKLFASQESKRVAAVMKAREETANAVQNQLNAQKTKVAGEKTKIDQLTRLQEDVNVKQAQYDKTNAKAVELRQEAAAVTANLTPLGTATVPPSPSFPNIPLIIAGAIVLGLGVGAGVALLAELFARRVRAAEDLEGAIDAPMLAVISGPARAPRSLPRRLRRQVNWPTGRKAVQG